MPESRRTERCRRHLAVGLCEDRTCKGSADARQQARRHSAGVAEVKPPRCSSCKRERADVILRAQTSSKRPRRLCDDCWERKLAFAEAVEVRKRFHVVLRVKKPRREAGESAEQVSE